MPSLSALNVNCDSWPGAVKLEAARPGHAVQVDVVRHLVAGIVLQVELHGVALANPDEAARRGAAEGPERVADAFGDLLFLFDDLEVDDHLGRVAAVDRRRHIGRAGQHGMDRGALRRPEVARVPLSGPGQRHRCDQCRQAQRDAHAGGRCRDHPEAHFSSLLALVV
jgi:hypothetical protein